MKAIGGRKAWMIITAAMAVLLVAAAARADIITYANSSKVLKGLIEGTTTEETDGGPVTYYTIRTAIGRVRVPETRIREIKREPRAEGLIHIGDEHLSKDRFRAAQEAYQQALEEDPDHRGARARLDEVDKRLAASRAEARQDQVNRIDELEQQAREAWQRGKFEDAEDMLQQASRLEPTEEQKASLKKAIGAFYEAWAVERLDRLDKSGAEDKLNLALAADPQNESVILKLLDLWEGDPTKREQAADVYETFLEMHPENDNLRRKLADLYYRLNRVEDAAHHYLTIYRGSRQYKGTAVEERLAELIERLELRAAGAGDLDKAIEYFDALAEIDPKADRARKAFYQYEQRRRALDPNDLEGRFALALFAEQNGLYEEAKDQFNQLLRTDMQERAEEALARYAQLDIERALQQYQRGNYQLAIVQAQEIRSAYPTLKEYTEAAAQLAGRAEQQLIIEQRERRKHAEGLKEQADYFFAQAQRDFSRITSTERDESAPALSSPRQDAIRNYRDALALYQQAAQVSPEIGRQPVVRSNIQTCQSRLRQLQTRPSLSDVFPRN